MLQIDSDSVDSHKKFKEKYNLPFTLLSDPSVRFPSRLLWYNQRQSIQITSHHQIREKWRLSTKWVGWETAERLSWSILLARLFTSLAPSSTGKSMWKKPFPIANEEGIKEGSRENKKRVKEREIKCASLMSSFLLDFSWRAPWSGHRAAHPGGWCFWSPWWFERTSRPEWYEGALAHALLAWSQRKTPKDPKIHSSIPECPQRSTAPGFSWLPPGALTCCLSEQPAPVGPERRLLSLRQPAGESWCCPDPCPAGRRCRTAS